MKLIPCPLNGLRPAAEFACGGEVRPMPPPEDCDDARWSTHVYHRSGAPGVKREWWYHIPSGYWFILERDTATDEILRSGDARDMLAEAAR